MYLTPIQFPMVNEDFRLHWLLTSISCELSMATVRFTCIFRFRIEMSYKKGKKNRRNDVQSIPEFFSNKTVFITGGTGFLGKALIEKILRSCPDVAKIYVLMRPKGNKSLEERLIDLGNLPVRNRFEGRGHPKAEAGLKWINTLCLTYLTAKSINLQHSWLLMGGTLAGEDKGLQ